MSLVINPLDIICNNNISQHIALLVCSKRSGGSSSQSQSQRPEKASCHYGSFSNAPASLQPWWRLCCSLNVPHTHFLSLCTCCSRCPDTLLDKPQNLQQYFKFCSNGLFPVSSSLTTLFKIVLPF